MQDVGSKEDTELSRKDLTVGSRELPVESLGHCQSVGNWMVFPTRVREKLRTQVYSFPLEKDPVGALSATWSFADALNHSAGPVNHCGSCAPKKLCHLRGSPQKFGNNLGTNTAEYRA